jgi:hypothetical protein
MRPPQQRQPRIASVSSDAPLCLRGRASRFPADSTRGHKRTACRGAERVPSPRLPQSSLRYLFPIGSAALEVGAATSRRRREHGRESGPRADPPQRGEIAARLERRPRPCLGTLVRPCGAAACASSVTRGRKSRKARMGPVRNRAQNAAVLVANALPCNKMSGRLAIPFSSHVSSHALGGSCSTPDKRRCRRGRRHSRRGFTLR